VRVRRRQHEAAGGGDELLHRLQEVTRLVEMLDQLASDHDARRLETERCEGLPALDIAGVRVEAQLARALDARCIGVDPDGSARLGGDDLVEPGPAAALRPHLPFIDEAEIDDAAASYELTESGEPVDEPRRWDAMHRRRPKHGRVHARQHTAVR
jgi:hypothetical protein